MCCAYFQLCLNFGLLFVDDSKLLLTGGGEYAARFWEVHSGKCLLKLDTAGPVKAVGFTSDAKQFFIMCNPVNKLTVFDLPQSLLSGEVYEGELVPKVTFSLQGTAARSAIWMPFNKVIACGGDDGKLRFYDTENPGTQPEVVPAHSGPVMRLAFNKTKSLFVTASKDTTAKLFLSTTKKELKTYKTPAPVNHAVISPLFNHVMCAGGQEARDVALRVSSGTQTCVWPNTQRAFDLYGYSNGDSLSCTTAS